MKLAPYSYIQPMAQDNLISIVESITDPVIQKQLKKIIEDKSLFPTEKEEIIKGFLYDLQSPQDSDESDSQFDPQPDFERTAQFYETHLVIDTVNQVTLFFGSDNDVLEYVIEKQISLDDLVIYRKQKARFSLEVSH